MVVSLIIGVLTNKTKNSQSTTLNKLIYKNKSYTDQQGICNLLNTYFVNVGCDLASKLPMHNSNGATACIQKNFQTSFMFRGILMHEVHDTIIWLNINKASVGIPRRCTKLASAYISGPLLKIFNPSLLQGVVPDIWKISKVTPVDKGGDTTDQAYYRPISTLSTFTPIFEKVVYKQLLGYI